jgi:hypothetical protein
VLKLGNTAHAQLVANELQDNILRKASVRVNSNAVEEDLLEHALPEDPPWPLQEGSQVRETVLANSSLETQRKVLEVCKAKGQGKKGKHKSQNKGKGPQLDDRADAHRDEERPSPAAPQPDPPRVDPEPTETNMQVDQREKRTADHLGDRNDRERNQDEEDEFQEAARYRRGDGHYT